MTRLRLVFLGAALAAAGPAGADTVRASSTTMLLGRQDFRDGSLQTAVPLYELLNLDASGVRTPYADLEIVVSTWGSADLADVRFWQNGARVGDHFTGDVNVGFVRADFLRRSFTLRLGRQMVADGNARMVHIDGAEGRLALPGGFGLSGYAGLPVAPRFARRGGDLAVGNIRATFTAGGRVSWQYPRLLDVGVSYAQATDHGDPSRQDLGADFRITPHRRVQLTGSSWWSLYEGRLAEVSLAGQVFATRDLDVTVDYRHVLPDLFLPRNSILSVFVSEKRNDVGGAVHWAVARNLALDADYHLLIQDSGKGHWARGKGTYHPGGPATTVGAEYSLLQNSGGNSAINDNGYHEVRLFGARRLAEVITGTLDLMAYFFDDDVNGESYSLAATATLAYQFTRGWRAALAGTAGSTPFLERQFEIMAKLVYEQTYAVREVR
jgi:hypothetical protein